MCGRNCSFRQSAAWIWIFLCYIILLICAEMSARLAKWSQFNQKFYELWALCKQQRRINTPAFRPEKSHFTSRARARARFSMKLSTANDWWFRWIASFRYTYDDCVRHLRLTRVSASQISTDIRKCPQAKISSNLFIFSTFFPLVFCEMAPKTFYWIYNWFASGIITILYIFRVA